MFFLLAIAFYFSSDDNDWVLWATVGAAVGVYFFYRGFRLLARRRLILNTPTSKIRSASIGLVEVTGLAIGPYTVPAPITGVPCYYYRTTAWQLKQSGKNKEWEKVAEESLHLPFYLDDNTGRLLIDPQGAELDIHCDFREEFSDSLFSTRPDVPPNVAGFLARHGVSADKRTKVEERCIKPKNALFILGTLAENPGLEVSPLARTSASEIRINSMRIEMPGRLSNKLSDMLESIPGATSSQTVVVTTVKDGGQPETFQYSSDGKPSTALDMTQQAKIAAAMTKAGITNPVAWAAAGISYPGVSVSPANAGPAGAATAEGFDLKPKTVLMKGTYNPAFFISWRSQREVLQSLGWKATLMIWGGPALTLFCVYLLAAHYGWL